MVGYDRNCRHRVDDGGDSHALGGATCGVVHQLHVIRAVFGKITCGEIGAVGNRCGGIRCIVPNEIAAVVARGSEGDGAFTATFHIAQLVECGTCVDG